MNGPETTSKTSAEPWGPAQPYLTQGYQAAQDFILNRPTQFFPGSTVVPFAPESEAALGATANRAFMGSPVLGAAQNYTQGLLTNPTDSAIYKTVSGDVIPRLQGTYAGAGRYGGSPGQTEAVSRGITAGVAPYMESAAARAPSLAREDYYDIDRLAQVGATREAKAGEQLTDAMARWEFGQREPAQRAQAYQATLSGLPIPISSTTRQSTRPDPLMTALGLGLKVAGTAGGFPTAGGGSLGASALGK